MGGINNSQMDGLLLKPHYTCYLYHYSVGLWVFRWRYTEHWRCGGRAFAVVHRCWWSPGDGWDMLEVSARQRAPRFSAGVSLILYILIYIIYNIIQCTSEFGIYIYIYLSIYTRLFIYGTEFQLINHLLLVRRISSLQRYMMRFETYALHCRMDPDFQMTSNMVYANSSTVPNLVSHSWVLR